jgi:NitT/TauT family transport system permease protein/putative hydroxymethylpyrimidine transport system permease protein
MAPVLVAVFGFDLRPKVIIVAIVTFFPIVVTTLDGLGSVDPGLRKLLRTFGASRWRAVRLVDLPAALPGMLSGAKIAVAVAVIGAVLSEDAGGTEGLGLVITQATNQLDTARSFAATVVLALLAGLLFAALTLAERRLVPWAPRTRPRGGTPT